MPTGLFLFSPQFLPLEANVSAEVPVIGYAPDLMPMFRKQYDNNIFIGVLEDLWPFLWRAEKCCPHFFSTGSPGEYSAKQEFFIR